MYFAAHLLAERGRLADELDALVGVERRHAELGELEVVGAVVEALLRLGVRLHRAALLLRRRPGESSSVDAPSPMTTMSLVRPTTFEPSMLMLASVFASG